MTLNKNIKETGEEVSPEEIANFSMAHKGHCYRNSNLNPASAEEPQAAIAAEELLKDSDGNYAGDDTAIFGHMINSDNDTRAPNSFIGKQNEIMGKAADKVAEHCPDKGHVTKDTNNAIFKLRDEDNTFGTGQTGLSNLRIKAINKHVGSAKDVRLASS